MLGRTSLTVLVLAAAGTLTACATKTARVTVYQPSFDFTPPSTAPAGDAGVTIALVATQYPGQEAPAAPTVYAHSQQIPATVLWGLLAPELPNSMARDFEEALVARGFTLKGPYDSYEEMVYSDKRDTDLVLIPELDITLIVTDFSVKQNFKLISDNTYSIERGVAQLRGRVNLNAYESMTFTKLWLKSLDVPETSIEFDGNVEYPAQPLGIDPIREVSFRTAVAQALEEEMYSRVLQTAWDYLDPQEMQVLKQQAEEIRAKAGFEIRR
jgi:hypothetical protein